MYYINKRLKKPFSSFTPCGWKTLKIHAITRFITLSLRTTVRKQYVYKNIEINQNGSAGLSSISHFSITWLLMELEAHCRVMIDGSYWANIGPRVCYHHYSCPHTLSWCLLPALANVWLYSKEVLSTV